MDSVKFTLGSRGMTVEAERQCTKDRKKWRALVHMPMLEFHAVIFARLLCSFGPPSPALTVFLTPGDGWDVVGINGENDATIEIKAQVPSKYANG